MSTLTVTTINTANGTTDLTLKTANNNAGAVLVESNGNPSIVFQSNSTTNVAFIVGNGNIGIACTSPASTLTVTGNASISTNTFTLGVSTLATNGYTILPNGLKMNWGFLTVNSVSNAVFTSAFTAAYNIVVTPAAAGLVGANTVYVPVLNAGNAQIRSVATSNPATFNCYYVAIGTI